MTIAELKTRIDEHVIASADDLADEMYEDVKAALTSGEERERVRTLLREYCESAPDRILRRAAGVVLSYLDGYCSPLSAL